MYVTGSCGLEPKPGILPEPWPWTPYFLPFSEPVDTKSSWSCIGFVHGAADELDPLDAGAVVVVVVVVVVLDAPLVVVVVAPGSVDGHAPGAVFAGNCRTSSPPHRLGPSAPHPEMDFTCE